MIFVSINAASSGIISVKDSIHHRGDCNVKNFKACGMTVFVFKKFPCANQIFGAAAFFFTVLPALLKASIKACVSVISFSNNAWRNTSAFCFAGP